MEPLLWFLLPVAAVSGWIAAKATQKPDAGSTLKPISQHPFNQHCIQGLNYLLSEESDKAIKLFVDLVDVDEDTVETHLVLGSLFRRRGEVDRAIRIHQNVIARPSLSPTQRNHALLQLGIDYLKAGLLDRAENIFLQLAEKDRNRPEVYRYLRSLYEQEREWQKAVDMALKQQKAGGASQNVRMAHYYCELVDEYVKQQKVDAAQSTLKRALSVDKECLRAYIQSGDLEASLGHDKAAIKHYRTALEMNRYFSPVIFKRLYDLFDASSRLDQFVDFILRQADCRNDAAARFFLIKTNEKLGKTAVVDQLLQEELKREEASPYIVKAYLERMREMTEGEIQASFSALDRVLDFRLSSYMACHCTQCGFESNVIFWQCPGCQSWSTVRPYQNPLEYSWLEAPSSPISGQASTVPG
ncbi:MAG TPA: lipopolysaccharide assembly protein LapB [Gammaproteobacteria bacterium]|nr:lipopolysaccharide assembly protein LapB [Gammaproteobacteria bacterium]